MYIDDEREAFFVDAHRKYHSKMENVCRAYVQYNEEYRSLIDESIQETYLTAVKNYRNLLSPFFDGASQISPQTGISSGIHER